MKNIRFAIQFPRKKEHFYLAGGGLSLARRPAVFMNFDDD
jgi:hypothetical protein